jgi:translation initiation factor 1
MADDEKKPFNNPFGALAGKLKDLPSAPQKPQQQKAPPKGPAKAVVRLERTGRGGKEVTVVEQLSQNPKELETWLKALKTGLGCGGVIEEKNLVLQGDQRERLEALLIKRGVQKVVIGN